MATVMNNQGYLFLIYCLCGAAIGIIFDIFRVLRKSFKTSDFVTFIEDILFGILTGIFLIFMLFVFNNGVLRFYIFLALITGMSLYLAFISKYFIKINVMVVNLIKKVITQIFRIILFPIKKMWQFLRKYVLKSILKPFKIMTINVKSFQIKKKNSKKEKNKKDFIEKCRKI